MDYWYTLEAAVPLTEYIGYFSPVKGVQEQIMADAAGGAPRTTSDKADALTLGRARLVPDPEASCQNVYNYKNLTEDEERQWNDLFNQVVNG